MCRPLNPKKNIFQENFDTFWNGMVTRSQKTKNFKFSSWFYSLFCIRKLNLVWKNLFRKKGPILVSLVPSHFQNKENPFQCVHFYFKALSNFIYLCWIFHNSYYHSKLQFMWTFYLLTLMNMTYSLEHQKCHISSILYS